MTRPDVAAPRPWHFPSPRETTLDNGLRVLVYDMPGQHVISAGLSLDVDLAEEPRALEGVGTLCLRTLDEGTLPHPGESFAAALEDTGAILDGTAGLSASQLYLDVPASRLAPALALLAEAVLAPEQTAAEVGRHVELRLAEIEQAMARSASLANIRIREAILDEASRAHRQNGGSPETLTAITAGDVHAFRSRCYGAGRATLVLAGAFTGDPLPAVAAAFGDWATGAPAAGHAVPATAEATRRLVHRPGAVQADVRIGGFGIDRSDERWPALQVAAHVVGGAFLSRLNRVLREELGYTYGVQLGLTPFRRGGLFSASGSFRTEVVADAVARAEQILADETPFSDAEIADARAYFVGTTPLRYATAGGVVGQIMALLAAGLGPDSADRLLQALGGVRPDDAWDAYRSVVASRPHSLVVVGDGDALEASMRERGDLIVEHS